MDNTDGESSGVNNCVFCEIVSGRREYSPVYEDDRVLAFMDIRPVSRGHVLVVPKEHYETIHEIPEDLLAHVFRVVKYVSSAVKDALRPDGINILQSNGRAALQTVPHLHVHIIPRYMKDGYPAFLKRLMHKREGATREVLDDVASKIRLSLR